MKHLKPEQWHALVYMEIKDGSEDEKSIIAISRDSSTIEELAIVLSEDRGYDTTIKATDDIVKSREIYNGQKLFATDTLTLTADEAESYEKEGRIIGTPKFRLNIPTT